MEYDQNEKPSFGKVSDRGQNMPIEVYPSSTKAASIHQSSRQADRYMANPNDTIADASMVNLDQTFTPGTTGYALKNTTPKA
jgi:hypothetical protein